MRSCTGTGFGLSVWTLKIVKSGQGSGLTEIMASEMHILVSVICGYY
jgi:hypothetical protein